MGSGISDGDGTIEGESMTSWAQGATATVRSTFGDSEFVRSLRKWQGQDLAYSDGRYSDRASSEPRYGRHATVHCHNCHGGFKYE